MDRYKIGMKSEKDNESQVILLNSVNKNRGRKYIPPIRFWNHRMDSALYFSEILFNILVYPTVESTAIRIKSIPEP